MNIETKNTLKEILKNNNLEEIKDFIETFKSEYNLQQIVSELNVDDIYISNTKDNITYIFKIVNLETNYWLSLENGVEIRFLILYNDSKYVSYESTIIPYSSLSIDKRLLNKEKFENFDFDSYVERLLENKRIVDELNNKMNYDLYQDIKKEKDII
jgi:hypothetical protein